MTSSHPTPAPCQWFSRLPTAPHPPPPPVPAVLPPRHPPRPPVRPQACPAVPRRRPGPETPDRHHLDQGGQSQRQVSVLLHRRRRRRQEGRQHRPTSPNRDHLPVAQG